MNFRTNGHEKLLALLCAASLTNTILTAGEAGVVHVWQVCDGLASNGPTVSRVYCHDQYAHSGIPAFALITAPNFPPSKSPHSPEDHNLLSASGMTISVVSEQPLTVLLDASQASIPKRFGITLPEMVKLAKEAIANTAAEWKIKDYQIVVKQPAPS